MRKTGILMLVAGWLLLGGVIWLAMDGWLEKRENPNAYLAREQGSGGEVLLLRNAAGHYVAPGRLNGVEVTFLVDTGATNVALPMAVAERVGAPPGQALRTHTAAGETVAYATRLRSVELAGLSAANVAGTIVPDMPGNTVLLGMSFLSRFAITMRDGEMRLQAR